MTRKARSLELLAQSPTSPCAALLRRRKSRKWAVPAGRGGQGEMTPDAEEVAGVTQALCGAWVSTPLLHRW